MPINAYQVPVFPKAGGGDAEKASGQGAPSQGSVSGGEVAHGRAADGPPPAVDHLDVAGERPQAGSSQDAADGNLTTVERHTPLQLQAKSHALSHEAGDKGAGLHRPTTNSPRHASAPGSAPAAGNKGSRGKHIRWAASSTASSRAGSLSGQKGDGAAVGQAAGARQNVGDIDEDNASVRSFHTATDSSQRSFHTATSGYAGSDASFHTARQAANGEIKAARPQSGGDLARAFAPSLPKKYVDREQPLVAPHGQALEPAGKKSRFSGIKSLLFGNSGQHGFVSGLMVGALVCLGLSLFTFNPVLAAVGVGLALTAMGMFAATGLFGEQRAAAKPNAAQTQQALQPQESAPDLAPSDSVSNVGDPFPREKDAFAEGRRAPSDLEKSLGAHSPLTADALRAFEREQQAAADAARAAASRS